LRLWDKQIASPLLDDGSIEFEFAFHNGDEADLKPGSRRPDKSAHQGLPNGIVFLCSDIPTQNAMTASCFMPCSKGQPERRASIKADVRRQLWIHEFTLYDARVELDRPRMMRCIIGRRA